ncbi:MAG: hypothetical protein GDA46_02605 [Bdellovibrionales bacterium]|nr:hypothetical protein [Bdellovibrionales bacterium]
MSKFLILSFLFFGVNLLFFQKSFQKKDKPLFYFAPSKNIKHFSLGFQEIYADILWMRLLQNVDFCSSQKGLPIYDGEKKYECKEGWSYKMTEAITELSPRFLAPYELVTPIMSIIMGDKLGAKKIYDKALINFPNNWRLHFNASYHYLIELENHEKAIPLLLKTADLGGPFWLYSLAAKSSKKIGKLLMAKEILQEAIKNNRSKKFREKFKKELKEVEKQISKLKNHF